MRKKELARLHQVSGCLIEIRRSLTARPVAWGNALEFTEHATGIMDELLEVDRNLSLPELEPEEKGKP